jgi:hypothetical protein
MRSEIREEIYNAIDSERAYQEKVWSSANKSSNATSISAYILWMEHYLHLARTAASTKDETPGTEESREMLTTIRKVVALGVAMAELNGGFPRRDK